MQLQGLPTPAQIDHVLARSTPEQEKQILALLKVLYGIWQPQPGPQTLAYNSVADVVGYGGAAGGGKTDLAIGKALTQHRKVAMFRREGTELNGLIDRMKEVIGHDRGYVGSGRWWGWRSPVPGVDQIEFGGVPNLGDETKHQGRPKDLLVIDEAANFLEAMVRFLMGWVRTTDPNQRCQTLMCFNPPTNAEGRWIIDFFGPWLNKKHPNPAKFGELRWFAVVNGLDTEVADAKVFVLKGKERVYEFNPDDYAPDQIIKPQSRTFIPARVVDNAYLLGTNYMAQLQSLPEPLRSQMLRGDFEAGMEDSEWQVIPTAWVEAAQARWKPQLPKARMDSMGIDVARGGKDNTMISRRHGDWYDELLAYPGTETPDGPLVSALAIANNRDGAPMHIDVIGVGASPYDFLVHGKQQVIGVDVRHKSGEHDKSGLLSFENLRSELVWKFREMLDPSSNRNMQLPPDRRLLVDLCAFRWEKRGKVIYVLSREEIIKLIGRSPDYASAVFLASMATPRVVDLEARPHNQLAHDPYADPGVRPQNSGDYDPYAQNTR